VWGRLVVWRLGGGGVGGGRVGRVILSLPPLEGNLSPKPSLGEKAPHSVLKTGCCILDLLSKEGG